MMRRLRSLASDERGATLVEYALLASLISAVLLTAFEAVGSRVHNNFDKVAAGQATALAAGNAASSPARSGLAP